ncbi:MAG: LytR family transcriptional regulator [Synechococcaceae bacterium WB7_1C_051]|nr:LytR family transcriptional regulator [Synechococcaceae bacterium WB7_1C_051]
MARVHPGGGVEIIQIPTELSVLLPGQKQLQPISNLYGQGGVALVADVVAQLMANGGEPVPPDRYLLLSPDGLREVINRIGGLPFDIETPLRYQDKAGKLKIELDAGRQWLGGKELEQFLQFKGPDKGDGGRRQRQQQLLLPLADRLADAAVAPQLPALLSQMRAQLNTNLSHGELLSLLAAGLKDPDLIQLSRLPLRGDQAARKLDQIRAEPLLELWHQAQAPSANNPKVNVEGIETISTNTAVERLQGAGLAAQASFLDAELMRPRTLILHGNGNNLKQAQAVRKALGLGELQRGPLSPGAGVQVLLGKDWQPSKP